MSESSFQRAELAAERMRDRRLRRLTLELIDSQKTNEHQGWVSGRSLMDMLRSLEASADAPQSERDMLAILRDLTLKNFVDERDTRTQKGQTFGIDVLEYRITGTGVSLVNCSIAPDPDIEDERVR